MAEDDIFKDPVFQQLYNGVDEANYGKVGPRYGTEEAHRLLIDINPDKFGVMTPRAFQEYASRRMSKQPDESQEAPDLGKPQQRDSLGNWAEMDSSIPERRARELVRNVHPQTNLPNDRSEAGGGLLFGGGDPYPYEREPGFVGTVRHYNPARMIWPENFTPTQIRKNQEQNERNAQLLYRAGQMVISGGNMGIFGSGALGIALGDLAIETVTAPIAYPYEWLTGDDLYVMEGAEQFMQMMDELGMFMTPEDPWEQFFHRVGESFGGALTFGVGGQLASATRMAMAPTTLAGRVGKAYLAPYRVNPMGAAEMDLKAGLGGGAVAGLANQAYDREQAGGWAVDFIADMAGGIGAAARSAGRLSRQINAVEIRAIGESPARSLPAELQYPDAELVPDAPVPDPPVAPPRPEPRPPKPKDAGPVPEPPPRPEPQPQSIAAEGPVAASEPPPPTPNAMDETIDPRGPITDVRGDPTSIQIPGEPSIQTNYAMVEGKQLRPSHSPETFAPNPDVPDALQTRPYHRDQAGQDKIRGQGQRPNPFDQAFIIQDSPGATDGFPIVTPGGLVLGGNARTMRMLRVMDDLDPTGSPASLRQSMIDNAERYGLDPNVAGQMEWPMIVRMLRQTPSYNEAGRLSGALNKTFTQGYDPGDLGIANARQLSSESVEVFANSVARAEGDDATIRQAIRDDPAFRDALQEDGIITTERFNEWVDDTGKLSSLGLDRVEDMMLGLVVADADLVRFTAGDLKRRVMRSIPSILRVPPGDADLRTLLADALRSERRRSATNMDIDTFLRSPDYLSPIPSHQDSRIAALQRLVATKKNRKFATSTTDMKRAFQNYADRMADSLGGQRRLIGSPEPISEREAFHQAFGEWGAPTPEQAAEASLPSPSNFNGVHQAHVREAERVNAARALPVKKTNPGSNYAAFIEAYQINPDAPIPAELIDRRDIVYKLMKKLDLTIAPGPFKNPAVAGHDGYFRPASRFMAVERWGDINTPPHELMHALVERTRDKQGQRVWRNWVYADTRRQYELSSISYDVDDPMEGLSELMRLHMTQPAHLESRVPQLYEEFKDMLTTTLSSKESGAIKDAARDMQAFLRAGSQHAIREKRAPGGRDPGSLAWAYGDYLRRGNFDQHHFWTTFDLMTLGGRYTPGGSWQNIRLLSGGDAIKGELIGQGPPVLKMLPGGEWQIDHHPTIRGLAHIMAPVIDHLPVMDAGLDMIPKMSSSRTRELAAFADYSDARQTQEIMEYHLKHPRLPNGKERKPIKTPFAKGDVDAWLAEVAKDPAREARFSKAFEDLVELQESVAQFLIDTSVLSKEQRARWRFSQHATHMLKQMHDTTWIEAAAQRSPTFRRVLDATLARGLVDPSGRRGNLPAMMQNNPGAYTMRGSERYLRDFFDRVLTGPHAQIMAGIENMVNRQIGRQIDMPGGGHFAERIPAAAKVTELSTEVMADKLKRAIMRMAPGDEKAELNKFFSELMDEVVEFAPQMNFYLGSKRPWGENIHAWMENGEIQYARITDPRMVDAFAATRRPPTGAITSFFSVWKNLYTAGVTHSLDFIYANTLARDPFMATVKARDGWQHVTHTLRGLGAQLDDAARYLKGDPGNDSVHGMIMNMGGQSTQVRTSTDLQREIHRRALLNNLHPSTVLSSPKKIASAVRAVVQDLQDTPRKTAARLLKGGVGVAATGVQAVGRTVPNVWRAMARLSAGGELSPRIGEYMRVVQQGQAASSLDIKAMVESGRFGPTRTPNERRVAMEKAWQQVTNDTNKRRAAFLAREITVDFGQVGKWKSVRFMAKTAPFANAMMQGQDNIYRALARDDDRIENGLRALSVGDLKTFAKEVGADRRFRTGVKGMMYVGMTLGAHIAMEDDPTYQQLPPELRMGYHHWIFRDPDTGEQTFHFKHPKMYDMGFIANFFEALYDNFVASEEPEPAAFGRALGLAVKHNWNLSLPVPLQVITDLKTNKDYLGYPITPEWLMDHDTYQRFANDQSETMRYLGEIQAQIDPEGKGWVSPATLEHIYNGFLGTMSEYSLMASDLAMRDRGVAMHLDEMPVFRKFMVREGRYNKDRRDFWDALEELQNFNKSLTNAEEAAKAGDPFARSQYQRYKDRVIPGAEEMMSNAQQDLSRGREDIRRIRQDPDWTRVGRMKAIDELKAMADRKATAAMNELRDLAGTEDLRDLRDTPAAKKQALIEEEHEYKPGVSE